MIPLPAPLTGLATERPRRFILTHVLTTGPSMPTPLPAALLCRVIHLDRHVLGTAAIVATSFPAASSLMALFWIATYCRRPFSFSFK